MLVQVSRYQGFGLSFASKKMNMDSGEITQSAAALTEYEKVMANYRKQNNGKMPSKEGQNTIWATAQNVIHWLMTRGEKYRGKTIIPDPPGEDN